MNKIIYYGLLLIAIAWMSISQASKNFLNLSEYESLVKSLIGESLNFDQTDPTVKKTKLIEPLEASLIIKLAHDFYRPNTSLFYQSTLELEQKTKTHCESIKNSATEYDPTKTNSTQEMESEIEAKSAWKNTMEIYHTLLASTFGPLYENSREIANGIYSWPFYYECGMHVETVQIKETGNFSSKALYTTQGLLGVEFGLFSAVDKTSCGSGKRFKKVQDWLKKDPLEKKYDLCLFAEKNIELLKAQALKLKKAWEPDQRNYAFESVNGTHFDNFKSMMNSFTDSLFYFEIAKDTQLGKPLGLHKDCLSETGKCPEDVEHKWSKIGFEALEMQFQGLLKILNFGFEDYLIQKSLGPESERFKLQLEKIISQIQTLKASQNLNQAVESLNVENCKKTTEDNNLVPVCALQKQVRTLVQIFKTDILPQLDLSSPKVFQGDAD